jgi:hypothetical protein
MVVPVLIVLFFIALIAVLTPIAAAVAVSLASNREDHDWALTLPPKNPLRAAARRIVDYHSGGIGWLRAAGHTRQKSGRSARAAGARRPPDDGPVAQLAGRP